MATRMKEKAAIRQKNADRRPRAIARYVRISSRKVKIVIDLIRGKNYKEAEAILMYTPKAASEHIIKLLDRTVADAENNFQMNRENLYVSECFVTPGPTLKRMMPRGKGSADRILKRTSHITLAVKERE